MIRDPECSNTRAEAADKLREALGHVGSVFLAYAGADMSNDGVQKLSAAL
ncbi:MULTISPECIES: hypothetical protein [Streptomyces]|nr:MULTISPECIES: hypothetical protein [Streptomyces]